MLAAWFFFGLSRLAPRIAGELALRIFRRPAPARAPAPAAGERLATPGGDVMLYRLPASDAGVRYAAGSAPPARPRSQVLLVHGWSGAAGDWLPLADALRDRGHDVLVLDLPGHGAVRGRRSSLPRFVRALAHIAPTLGPVNAWVAHSGGALAAVAALAQLPAAHRPARAVLIAPLARARHALEAFCRTLRMTPDATAAFVDGIERAEKMSLDVLDGPAHASALSLPMLIVHDEGDRYVPFSNGRELQRAFAHAELVTTSGFGHRRVLSAPPVLQRVVDYVAA